MTNPKSREKVAHTQSKLSCSSLAPKTSHKFRRYSQGCYASCYHIQFYRNSKKCCKHHDMHSQQIKIILLCFSFCLLDSQTGQNAGSKEKRDFRELQLGEGQHEGCQAMEDAFGAKCSQDLSLCFSSFAFQGLHQGEGTVSWQTMPPCSRLTPTPAPKETGHPPRPCTDASEYLTLAARIPWNGKKRNV